MLIQPPENHKNVPGRSCQGCTKCCEGFLYADIHAQKIGPGNPCTFCIKGKGCSIYDYRPADICKTFKCEWLINPAVPEEMKPSKSHVIVKRTYVEDDYYIAVIPAGKPIDIEIVEWAEKMVEDDKFDKVWVKKGRLEFAFSKNTEWRDQKYEQFYEELRKSNSRK